MESTINKVIHVFINRSSSPHLSRIPPCFWQPKSIAFPKRSVSSRKALSVWLDACSRYRGSLFIPGYYLWCFHSRPVSYKDLMPLVLFTGRPWGIRTLSLAVTRFCPDFIWLFSRISWEGFPTCGYMLRGVWYYQQQPNWSVLKYTKS